MVRGTRRGAAALMVMALGLAGCGGDDDSSEGAGDDAGTEAPAATGDDGDNAGADAPEPPADEETADDEPGGSGGGSGSIGSLSDIPERCRALMADFLRDLEPIAEKIDWENATLSDFEAISEDFEALSEEFDTEAVDEECNDLDIEDEAGFELILEFAADVAPGTVPFFEFIQGLQAGMVPTGDDGDAGAGLPGASSYEDCDDMIASLEELVAKYDSMAELPVSELSKFASMGSVMMTCTPEQLERLDSPEMTDFFGG